MRRRGSRRCCCVGFDGDWNHHSLCERRWDGLSSGLVLSAGVDAVMEGIEGMGWRMGGSPAAHERVMLWRVACFVPLLGSLSLPAEGADSVLSSAGSHSVAPGLWNFASHFCSLESKTVVLPDN